MPKFLEIDFQLNFIGKDLSCRYSDIGIVTVVGMPT